MCLRTALSFASKDGDADVDSEDLTQDMHESNEEMQDKLKDKQQCAISLTPGKCRVTTRVTDSEE